VQLRTGTLFAITGFLAPAYAQAATCQQSVVKSGSLWSGHQFSAQAEAQGLSVDTAFKSVRAQFNAAGLRVFQDDPLRGRIVADASAKLLEPARQVTLDYRQGRETATIRIVQSYPPGVMMSATAAGDQLCNTFAQLFRDARVQQAVQTRRPPPAIGIDATALALQVKDARDNPARVNTQFIGRIYRVGGTVRRITETQTGYAVAFEVEPRLAEFEVRKAWIGIDVTCKVERARAPTVAALSINERASLIGRFAKFDDYRATPTIILEDCQAP
jgi:hypothetical protein